MKYLYFCYLNMKRQDYSLFWFSLNCITGSSEQSSSVMKQQHTHIWTLKTPMTITRHNILEEF